MVLWATTVMLSLKGFRILKKRGDPEYRKRWAMARGAFVSVAACYIVQASALSAIWPVFAGSGLGAAFLAMRRNRADRRLVYQAPRVLATVEARIEA